MFGGSKFLCAKGYGGFVMNDEILYKRIKDDGRVSVVLDYYIIPENISADYCDLKCYGIKIKKTSVYEGRGKTVDIKQINNVFYRLSDTEEFMAYIAEKRTEPCTLREAVEKYIVESIDRAKKSA